MIRATGRFRRSERVRRPRDFARIGRTGERAASRHFVLLVAPPLAMSRRPSARRLGVTVSRAVGNSVARNRVKRSIREWYRQASQPLERLGDADIVVIARRGAAALGGTRMAEELADLAAQIKAEK